MEILRAKTVDLLQTRKLTELQRKNTSKNIRELNEGARVLKSLPRRIVLELTNACNINCKMCGRDHSEFKLSVLDRSHLINFGDILKHVEEVTLFGWGEPTLHPEFIEILAFLDRYPVRKYFTTNGTKLKKIRDVLFDYAVDIMAVSLDGASASTNSQIRIGSHYNEIVSDLSDIVHERKRRNLRYPYINFVFTAMRSNILELPDMVRLAHDIGLEEVKVVYLTVFSDKLLGESLINCQKAVSEVFDDAANLAGELNIKLKLPFVQGEDSARDKFHKDCFVGWRDVFIGSDGYVRPCQSTAMKLFHISQYDTFEEMWNSLEYQEFRCRVNNCESMPSECRRCYQSSHANWNKTYPFIQIGNEYAPMWDKSVHKPQGL